MLGSRAYPSVKLEQVGFTSNIQTGRLKPHKIDEHSVAGVNSVAHRSADNTSTHLSLSINCSSSSWIKLPDKLSPSLKQLRFQVNELLQTEDNYVTSLRDVEQGYLLRLREDTNIDVNTLNAVFYRIIELRALHQELNSELQSAKSDLGTIARVFLNFVSRMEEVYVDYCVNYSGSVQLLESAQAHQTYLWHQILACQRGLGHQLPLVTYMLKPVQRILRYQLILQECIQHCTNAVKELTQLHNSSTPGYSGCSAADIQGTLQLLQQDLPLLQQGCSCMVELASHVNERKRCRELIDHLRRSNHHLVDIDLWGNLVLRDYFRLPGKKGPRFVVLFDRAILLCKHTFSALSVSRSGSLNASATAGCYQLNTSLRGQHSSQINTGLSLDAPVIATIPTLPMKHCATSPAALKQLDPVEIREVINCANLMLIECIPKNPLAFHILPFDNPKAQRTLQAASLDIKRLWCREIKRLILDNYDATIPDKAKHIVLNMSEMKSPASHDESISLQNKSPSDTSLPIRSASSRPSLATDDRVPMLSQPIEGKKGTTLPAPNSSSVSFMQCSNNFIAPVSSPGPNNHRPVTGNGHGNGTIESTEDGHTEVNETIHQVWTNLWAKHNQSSNRPDPHTESQPVSNLESCCADGRAGGNRNSELNDFRCIAVEINEERLHGPSSLVSPSRSRFNRYKKSRAPSLPPSFSSVSSFILPNQADQRRSSTPSRNATVPASPGLFITCPSTNNCNENDRDDVYDQYIAKARTRLALSPEDLDELFYPLRQLTDRLSANSSVSSPSSKALAHGVHSSVDYRLVPPPPVNWTDSPHPVEEDDNAIDNDGLCSSGASSPRHFVSWIAVQHQRKKSAPARRHKHSVDLGQLSSNQSRNNSQSALRHYSLDHKLSYDDASGILNDKRSLSTARKSTTLQPVSPVSLAKYHGMRIRDDAFITNSKHTNLSGKVQLTSGAVDAFRLRSLLQLPSRSIFRSALERTASQGTQSSRSVLAHSSSPPEELVEISYLDRKNISPLRADFASVYYMKKKSRAPEPPAFNSERAPLAEEEEESSRDHDQSPSHFEKRENKRNFFTSKNRSTK